MTELLFHMAQLGCLNPVYPAPKAEPRPGHYAPPSWREKPLVQA